MFDFRRIDDFRIDIGGDPADNSGYAQPHRNGDHTFANPPRSGFRGTVDGLDA
jgi:hypothetical protein